MSLSTSNSSAIVLPDQVGDLVIRPTLEQSLAASTTTVIETSGHSFRAPILTGDVGASWVNEGAEVPVGDPTLDEVIITPTKVARIVAISRELAMDSNPAAAQIVGDSIARSLAKAIDAAFVSTVASPAPQGLSTLSGVTGIPAGSAWTNFDWAEDARSAAEGQGAQLDSWIMNPATALALAKLKRADGSNENLLTSGGDPTQASRRLISGLPVFVSPDVDDNVIWGVPKQHVLTVIRLNAEVTIDNSIFFTSDRVAVKGVIRASFGFTHPAAVAKVTVTP